jgi:hypothetical protein
MPIDGIPFYLERITLLSTDKTIQKNLNCFYFL